MNRTIKLLAAFLLAVTLFSASLAASISKDLTFLINKAASVDYEDILHAREIAVQLNKQAMVSEQDLNTILNALSQSPHNTLLAKYLLPDLADNPSDKITTTAINLLTSKKANNQLIGLEIFSSRPLEQLSEKEQLLTALFVLFDDMKDDQVINNVFGLLQAQSFPESSHFRIAQALQPLCLQNDESIRSNTYFALSRFAQNEGQLTCLIDALETASSSINSSALMALSQSSVKSQNIKKALESYANNANKSSENRANAKQLLESY